MRAEAQRQWGETAGRLAMNGRETLREEIGQ
jgi:hypothetical protein